MEVDQTPGDITIIMYSPGGDVDLAISMYDMIKSSSNHVSVIGAGLVGSAAILPFVAADVRLMQPNCKLFLHEILVSSPQESAWSKTRVNRVSHTANEQFIKYCTIVSKNIKSSLEEVIAMCGKDTYLSIEDAAAFGFVHGQWSHSDKKKKSDSPFFKATSKLTKKVKNGKN